MLDCGENRKELSSWIASCHRCLGAAVAQVVLGAVVWTTPSLAMCGEWMGNPGSVLARSSPSQSLSAVRGEGVHGVAEVVQLRLHVLHRYVGG